MNARNPKTLFEVAKFPTATFVSTRVEKGVE
jgi:polyisoprenoid-binding protein YceI